MKLLSFAQPRRSRYRFEIPIHLIRPSAAFLCSHVGTRAPCPHNGIEIPLTGLDKAHVNVTRDGGVKGDLRFAHLDNVGRLPLMQADLNARQQAHGGESV